MNILKFGLRNKVANLCQMNCREQRQNQPDSVCSHRNISDLRGWLIIDGFVVGFFLLTPFTHSTAASFYSFVSHNSSFFFFFFFFFSFSIFFFFFQDSLNNLSSQIYWTEYKTEICFLPEFFFFLEILCRSVAICSFFFFLLNVQSIWKIYQLQFHLTLEVVFLRQKKRKKKLKNDRH